MTLMPEPGDSNFEPIGEMTVKATTVKEAAEIATTEANLGFIGISPVRVILIKAEPVIWNSIMGQHASVGLWECEFTIHYDTAFSEKSKACGAWPNRGGCILRAGHNMGRVDIPEAHEFPVRRVEKP